MMMGNDTEDDDSFSKPLGRRSVLYYGVGHMLNDITAACWFTYLLLFLTDIGLSPRDAATVMLSGQVADGFTTIFAGELTGLDISKYGMVQDPFWLLFHFLLFLAVAYLVKSLLPLHQHCELLATVCLQQSSMSMVNCITLNSTSRIVLNSCRNAFTMVANLTLYAVALIVFAVTKAETNAGVENQYRWIAYSSIFFGCFFVGIFHLRTKEPRSKVQGNSHARIAWAYWFKRVLYYEVALVYVLTRLVINVSQAYLAFYVINDLRMAQSAKALVPAIIYICSFIVSVILQEIAWTGQRLKAYYSAGGILWIFCGAAILLLPRSMSALMYIISIFIGIANALMTVTGVSMQSVLIGENLGGCAFVCGSLSFLDKISCGLALYVLQSFQSSSPELHLTNPMHVYISVTRIGLGLIPPFCSLVGVAVTYTMKLHTSFSKPIMEPLLA
ncbi:uncharacterized protein LOC133879646 isoform X3 [Alnus glutinosa]|uniref:uncharacterized protein LOC133879646 isoform X3 n=1 Tax=Alnus glutinosa TaxID=3517 RepID=UPI002D782A22|nr:uncharacterized protein LOC133879646 isoform X3 [Alnus glutinosa]